MSERYGKGMRHCCDSPAQPSQKHIKGCHNEENANSADAIEALSSKNEEQALAIRELVEVLESAKELADVMEGLSSCRSDDEWVWAAQAKINAAIAKARQP